MPGFIDLELSRSIESPSTYLLLVRWERASTPTMIQKPTALRWVGVE